MASRAESQTARWVQKEVNEYGPLTKGQVAGLAGTMESKGHPLIAHGLRRIATEMRDDEVVTGSAKTSKWF